MKTFSTSSFFQDNRLLCWRGLCTHNVPVCALMREVTRGHRIDCVRFLVLESVNATAHTVAGHGVMEGQEWEHSMFTGRWSSKGSRGAIIRSAI